MSSQDLSPVYYPSAAANGAHSRVIAPARHKERYWLHALMFALTLASTTIVGARMQDRIAGELGDKQCNHIDDIGRTRRQVFACEFPRAGCAGWMRWEVDGDHAR